MLNISLKLLYY